MAGGSRGSPGGRALPPAATKRTKMINKKKTLGDPWGTKGIHACVKGGTRGKAFSHFVADASQSPSVLPALVQCPCELAPSTQTVSSAFPVREGN